MSVLAKDLRSLRELLGPPGAWIKGENARCSPGGYGVSPHSSAAACFCLNGGIACVTAGDGERSSELSIAIRRVIGGGIIKFNDDARTTHADVLDVIDSAIEQAT